MHADPQRTLAGHGASFGSPAAFRAAKPLFARLARKDIALVNRWYRPRHALMAWSGDLEISVSARNHSLPLDDRTAFVVGARMQGYEILLLVDLRIKDAIAASYRIPAWQLGTESAFLLLVDRLSGLLDRIEQYAGIEVAGINLANAERLLKDMKRLEGVIRLGDEEFPFAIALPNELEPLLLSLLDKAPVRPANCNDALCQVVFRIGSVDVTLSQLNNIRLNDIILADTTTRGSDALVIFGNKCAARADLVDRQLKLLEYPRSLVLEMSGKATMALPLQPLDRLETEDAAFEEIQVTIVFEIGQQQMPVGDLRNLGPGYVFDLARPPRTAVDIYTGARRIGHGEIVEINDTLGVRVTRFFNNE